MVHGYWVGLQGLEVTGLSGVRIGIKGLGVRVWGWVWGCGWRFWDYMETLQGEGLRILVMGLGFGVSGSGV